MAGFFVGQMISTEKRHYYCGVGRGMAAIKPPYPTLRPYSSKPWNYSMITL